MPPAESNVTGSMSPVLPMDAEYTDDLYGITIRRQVPCVRVALTYMEMQGLGFSLLMLAWWRPLN